jgi:hypothetical protein
MGTFASRSSFRGTMMENTMTITAMKSIVIMAWMVGTLAQAGQREQQITVYLRDRVFVRNSVQVPAEALASDMFAKIGIYLKWVKSESVGPTFNPSILIDLITDTPADRLPSALAYTRPSDGVHITVFFDRIEEMQKPATVLGHVMVHEITHLLQGVSHHSDTGVMKAHWTSQDFREMWYEPLMFTDEDIELVYSGLAARTAMPVALAVPDRMH